MAAYEICTHYKYGYCRYLEKCRKRHVKEKCNNSACDIASCTSRHPKICRYWRDYGFCKFGEYCYYSHNDLNAQIVSSIDFENIQKKLSDLEQQIRELKIEENLRCKVQSSEEADGVEREQEIEKAAKSNFTNDDERRVKDLEENFYILLHSVDDLERITKAWTTPNSSTIHRRRYTCNWCGKSFETEPAFKTHLRVDHG